VRPTVSTDRARRRDRMRAATRVVTARRTAVRRTRSEVGASSTTTATTTAGGRRRALRGGAGYFSLGRAGRCCAAALAALTASTARAASYEARRSASTTTTTTTRATVSTSGGMSGGAADGAYPAPIVVEPRDGARADCAFIMLHGLGDTGHGWAGASTQIETPRGANVRWVFPTAKTVPVTLNMGMRMTAWFDLNALDEASVVDDRAMIMESVAYVDSLVKAQIESGIPSEKIIIGGFSQGGVIALTAALRSEVKLAGCVALSTYLPLRGDYPGAFGPHAKTMPFLQGHGTNDMVLQYSYGERSFEFMKTNGVNVDFKTYVGMAHSACAEEFDDIKDFLASALA